MAGAWHHMRRGGQPPGAECAHRDPRSAGVRGWRSDHLAKPLGVVGRASSQGARHGDQSRQQVVLNEAGSATSQDQRRLCSITMRRALMSEANATKNKPLTGAQATFG